MAAFKKFGYGYMVIFVHCLYLLSCLSALLPTPQPSAFPVNWHCMILLMKFKGGVRVDLACTNTSSASFEVD